MFHVKQRISSNQLKPSARGCACSADDSTMMLLNVALVHALSSTPSRSMAMAANQQLSLEALRARACLSCLHLA